MKEMLSAELAEGTAALAELATNPIGIGLVVIGGAAVGATYAYKKTVGRLPFEGAMNSLARAANAGWRDKNYSPPTWEELFAEVDQLTSQQSSECPEEIDWEELFAEVDLLTSQETSECPEEVDWDGLAIELSQ